jgi:hypothetical protein
MFTWVVEKKMKNFLPRLRQRLLVKVNDVFNGNGGGCRQTTNRVSDFF